MFGLQRFFKHYCGGAGAASSAPASRPGCRSSTRTRARSAPIASSTRSPRSRSCKAGLHRRRLRHRDDVGRRQPQGRVPRRRDRARASRSAPRRSTSTRRSCRASSSRARARSSRATRSRRCRPGLVYGYAGMVDALVERIRAEVDWPARCIATGGLARADRDRDQDDRGHRRAADAQGPQDPVSPQRLRASHDRAHPARPESALAGRAARARPGPGADDGRARACCRCRRPIRSRCSTSSRSMPTPALASGARATAVGLPEKLLAGTLARSDARSARPRLLRRSCVADKPPVFDAIALNPSVADETLAMLAAQGRRARGRSDRAERAAPAAPSRDHRGDVHEPARAHVDDRSRRRARGAQPRPRPRPRCVGRGRARAGRRAAPRRRRVDALFDARGRVADRATTARSPPGDAEQALPEDGEPPPGRERRGRSRSARCSGPGEDPARDAGQRVRARRC